MLNKLLCVFALALAVQAPVFAEQPGFEIKGFVLEKATLIDGAELQAVVAPYVGKDKGMADIQAAMVAVEHAYSQRGYGAVKTVLPEQELEDGVVRIQVIAAKIGQVEVVGNQHFSAENVRRSLPGLREGAHPDLVAIDNSLRVANESASKKTNLILRRGSNDGEVDASVRVADENPLRFALMADNSGTPDANDDFTTGRFRVGFVALHANLFDLDHAFSFQYLTSPDHVKDVTVIGAGYRIPLYSLGDALEFGFAYSNVNSGQLTTVAGPIGISGSGQFYLVKYDQMLPRWGDWLGKLTYGFDYKVFRNDVTAEGSGESLIPDATVHPVSISYSGQLAQEGRVISAALTYAHNIPGGRDGTTADFTAPGGRVGATANYQLWRYSAAFMQSLPANWVLNASLNGQYTSDALIAGEQFGVGGLDSVRGFYTRQLANDKGVRGTVEIWLPELFDQGFRMRPQFFLDAATLGRNEPQPGEIERVSVSSYGLGVRGGYSKQLTYRLDLGVVIDGGGVRNSGDTLLQGSMVLLY